MCSFIFLLIGLAAIASSINQLVLRFMMLSLEEDKEDNEDALAGGPGQERKKTEHFRGEMYLN
jgi:hypothetical protein